MKENKKELIDLLLNTGKVYKLKCDNCKSIAVQITQNEETDYICYECGSSCTIL